MTPAIDLVKQTKIAYQLHEYCHDSSSTGYGLEAAEKLNIDAARVFKTLVVELDKGQLGVAIVPVSSQLNMKFMASACSTKKATMANTRDVERATGYVIGGVSPLGQKKRLPTVVDLSSYQYKTIFISAGRRGLEIELSPKDLTDLIGASAAQLCEKQNTRTDQKS